MGGKFKIKEGVGTEEEEGGPLRLSLCPSPLENKGKGRERGKEHAGAGEEGGKPQRGWLPESSVNKRC